jgi:hypothetical protein
MQAIMLLECNKCEAIVDAKEIAEHEYIDRHDIYPPWDDDLEDLVEMTCDAKVVLVICPMCNCPMLAYKDESRPDFYRLYPPMERDLDPSTVPQPICRAFTEARTCFRAKAFIATAIMCRKILEGICSAHGLKPRRLVDELKELKEKGIIESRLFEWAEALRTMGNEAAHGVEFVVSRADAIDTLQFTEALIEYVFTYRDRFEDFKKRRAKRASSSKEIPAEEPHKKAELDAPEK